MSKFNEEEILIMIFDKKLSCFVDKTNQVQWYSEDYHSCRVKFFNSDNFYHKSYRDLEIHKQPKIVEFTENTYLNGHKLKNYIKAIQFEVWIKVFYNNGSTRVFHENQISNHSNLIQQGSNNILRFNYFMELAKESSYQDNEFLASLYDKLDYISNESILSKYLRQDNIHRSTLGNSYIYPFGLNLSQKKAVENAFSYDLSVIEGPPGTGKTQTILNIIANAVLFGKSVAVVSNNNAAIQNVKDKLAEYNLDFLVALLGNKDNKNLFFDETIKKEKPLGFLEVRELNNSKDELIQLVSHYQNELPIMYEKENKLASLIESRRKYELEFSYYMNDNEYNEEIRFSRLFNQMKNSSEVFRWKLVFENLNKSHWIQRLKIRLFYKIRIKDLVTTDIDIIIRNLEFLYYKLKISEIDEEVNLINNYLSREKFEKGKTNYELVSLELLKRQLYKKYNSLSQMEYTYENYRHHFDSFINEFPVILSTSYALMPSADLGFMFDYLIIDEASQTDILSSVLAMSCAKNMIVVGDTKQLPQIPINHLENVNEELKENYRITKGYDYFNNNILTSIIEIYKNVPRVLLKEHYRCHPDIINFCNQKFYNNQLIILTKRESEPKPLYILKTIPGNHARSNPNGSGMYNQREIDEIKLIVNDIKSDSVGVITPFRYQAELMSEELSSINSKIEVDTVHKFQGRAKDYIILSTVANELRYSNNEEDSRVDFVSRRDLLNVAISRARKQLVLVVSDKLFNSRNNTIAEFVKYIKYNSPKENISSGNVKSIYDILYRDYQKELIEFRKKHNKKEIITELITLDVINKIIKRFESYNLNVIMHYPLRVLIKDFSKLNDEEIKYVTHEWSHVDFTIFSEITREPVLVIEVDGISYHEQDDRQHIRDIMKDKALELNNLPLLRLKTNESDEESRIIDALKVSVQSQ